MTRTTKILTFGILCIGVSVLIIIINSNLHVRIYGTSHPILPPARESTICPDVLKFMTQGTWKMRSVTSQQHLAMTKFLTTTRGQHLLPTSLQRADNKCGNVTFDNLKAGFHSLLWFRALCDPYGANPCCYNHMCTNRTLEQCACPNCYDLRQSLNAEHASWIPKEKSCQVPEKNNIEMCEILNNTNILFLGDSFTRHIFLSFVLLLKNNTYDGGMKLSTPKAIHDRCTGMYMYSEKECRFQLNTHPVVCDNRVHIQFEEYMGIPTSQKIYNIVTSLANHSNTVCIIGQGIHDNYNHAAQWSQLLYPIVSHKHTFNLTWPRLVWAAPHAPGLLKTPRVPEQSHESVLRFNQHIKEYLTKWNIPVFDSFNITDGVNSFDGAHYGMGVNFVKARILIEYIKELRTREKW